MWKSLLKRPWFLTILLCLIPGAALAADEAAGKPFIELLDEKFAGFVKVIFDILFFSIGGFPLIVIWLIFGAVFFTIRMGFVNFRMFGHAIEIVRGKHDPEEGCEFYPRDFTADSRKSSAISLK